MTRPTAFTLPGLTAGLVVVLGLGCGILLGSRNLRNYDPTLLIYTFGAMFSAFAITYRYTVWLQRPPTRVYWRRGWQLLLQRQDSRAPSADSGRRLWQQLHGATLYSPTRPEPLAGTPLHVLGDDTRRGSDVSAGLWLDPF